MRKILIIVLCLNFLYSPISKSEELLSNIIVLIDFSTSYFKPEKKQKLEKTLSKVNKVILKAVDILPLNMAIEFIPIREESITSDVICGVEFAGRNIAGKQVGLDGISKKKELKMFLNDCTNLILKQTEGKATDLTGAIRKAVLMSSSQLSKGELRTVIILSDFIEERGASFKDESLLSLNDFSFALIYPGALELSNNQEVTEVKNQAENLKSNLLKQGAKNVNLYLEDARFHKLIPNDMF